MTRRILLFDEDYHSMSVLKEALESQGYEVELTAAASVLDALTQTRYDLIGVDFMIHPESLDREGEVVSNVHFDGVNWRQTGEEFLHRLRAGDYEGTNDMGTPRTVPAVIISATVDLKQEYSAAAIFEKPFDLPEVLKKVDALLKG